MTTPDREIAPIASHVARGVAEQANIRPETVERELSMRVEPLLLRGLVADWPAVAIARTSSEHLRNYIASFDSGTEVSLFNGSAELNGRIFYNKDFSGLNCDLTRTLLPDALDKILAAGCSDPPPLAYIGATPIAGHLPGFANENAVHFNEPGVSANIWIGGPSRISAHYDFSDNLACVVAGARRFILFPPDQLPNLYVGPIDFTPAGQPISLINFHEPDFNRFPRFRIALDNAVIADLVPGDALFIPSMWWHHVEALGAFNVLVNYWYRRSPRFLGAPMTVLEHALMTLRDLPPEQKEAWRVMFDHYVFGNEDDLAEHIPEEARGVLKPITADQARKIRTMLAARLNA